MRFEQRLSLYFTELGRKSVKARMKKVSAKRRKEIAQNAAKARWGAKKNTPGIAVKSKAKKKL